MLVRMWRGAATTASIAAYERHLRTRVFPELKALAGHRGARLLTRDLGDGRVEVLAVTYWDSLDSIRAFAGPDVSVAVVEPAARAALVEFDEVARHYEIALDSAAP